MNAAGEARCEHRRAGCSREKMVKEFARHPPESTKTEARTEYKDAARPDIGYEGPRCDAEKYRQISIGVGRLVDRIARNKSMSRDILYLFNVWMHTG